MEKVYNKLVRDYIPEIIKSNGGTPFIKKLDDVKYRKELEKKINEEYLEVLSAEGNDRIEELADMLEVMIALAKLENKSLDDIIKIMEELIKKIQNSIEKKRRLKAFVIKY